MRHASDLMAMADDERKRRQEEPRRNVHLTAEQGEAYRALVEAAQRVFTTWFTNNDPIDAEYRSLQAALRAVKDAEKGGAP